MAAFDPVFGYPNPAAGDLMRAFAAGDRPLVCALPDGPLLRGAAAFFGREDVQAGEELARGALVLRAMPFVAQDRYDELLWTSDVNFVRGEDSFVRAQWAARPLIWQIYPQAGEAHWTKLEAFHALYCEGLDAADAAVLGELWRAWNRANSVFDAWMAVESRLPAYQRHAESWCRRLAGQTDLASRLADFCMNRLK